MPEKEALTVPEELGVRPRPAVIGSVKSDDRNEVIRAVPLLFIYNLGNLYGVNTRTS